MAGLLNTLVWNIERIDRLYRPDIDGLRALAVLPVVLFHADVAYFGGGFVGVDIFFVISGYLITGHLLTDMGRGTFSFGKFYERRVRRILPALVAVVAFTLAAGSFLLVPGELIESGRAARSIGYFSSNHLFWQTQSDYWNQNALAVQPLLHTWSLAVEEQFYLVFPCLLALAYRLRRRSDASARGAKPKPPMLEMALLVVASLVFSVALMRSDTAAAFYLLPARAWELLAGGLLAGWLAGEQSRRASVPVANICGFVGLALVVVPVFTYTDATPFPGIGALPVVLGASLTIYAGSCRKPSIVSRALSLRPLVVVGLISYSLYLWHWPLLVFFRSAGWYAWDLPEIPTAGIMAIVFGVSWLSWRWIERPFRRKAVVGRRLHATLGAGAIVSIAMFVCGSVVIEIGQDSPGRFRLLPELVVQLGEDIRLVPGIRCESNPDPVAIREGSAGCRLGRPDSLAHVPEFLLVGDSHARMWVAGLDRIAWEFGVSGAAFTYSSCTPVRGYVPPSRPECAAIMDALLDFVAAQPVRRIFLAGYWMDSADAARSAAAGNEFDFWAAMEQTAAFLRRAGKEVIFIEDVPELANDLVPYRKGIESIKDRGQAAFGPSLKEHLSRQSAALEVFERMREQVGIRTLSPTLALCGTGRCMVARDSRTWYRDMHHLTDYGAIQLRTMFQTVLVGN